MLQEFRNFINKGNVLDLAVAVILGAAFGKIVGSLVEDIIMPIIGGLFQVNFVDIKLGGLAVGKFIQSVVDFFLVAIPVFFIVKAAAKTKLSAPPPPPPPPTSTDVLLTEIRDLLKKQ
ncbi:MAG: large conductance mechanosensitive channel protein MscL [Saprospiraceae bacterium]